MSAADWKPYDVPGLAGLLAEQPTDSGLHAMAWQQAYETLTAQRQGLQAARAALNEAWPATPGSAAGSFFDQLDALTQAMGATAENAVNSHGALTGIVTAVDGATAKVDTLHQSWRQSQATIDDVVPTDEWTQPLNEQAHAVMGQADAAIAEHATQLVPPVPYTPQIRIENLNPLPSSRTRQPVQRLPNQASSSQTNRTRLSSKPILTGHGSSVQSMNTNTIAAQTIGRREGHALLTGLPSAAGIDGTDDGVESVDNPGVSGRRFSNPRSSAHGIASRDSAATGDTPGTLATHASGATVFGVDSPATEVNRGGVGVGGFESSLRLPLIHANAGHTPTNSARLGFANGPSEPTDGTLASPRMSDSAPNQPAAYTRSLNGTLGTDGTIVAGNSNLDEHAQAAARIGGVGDPLSSGALVANGTLASSSNASRKRPGRAHVEWLMPNGVPPVIQAQPEVPVRHDPGTGVIGIDR